MVAWIGYFRKGGEGDVWVFGCVNLEGGRRGLSDFMMGDSLRFFGLVVLKMKLHERS